ncbi:MAG: DUF4962 domain-containing protein [Thermoguttaceae bacterium]|nr:DUF4962 domain-containing protein [Thermoguttaceae bacterium]MDW8078234.1 DUF4962 domain-containing protein [Thermoguttaceae bacterium]
MKRHQALRSMMLLAVWIILAAEAFAQLAVSNRPATVDEWGYRPQDGEVVALNPPSLTWVHEPQAAAYEVQWATREDLSDARTVRDIPWPVYTHHEPLRPGTYWWRYRFRTKEGKESTWSQVRKFTVPPQAVEFPLPSREERRARIPKGHPRLFVRPEQLPKLRELARTSLKREFDVLVRQAERIIKAGPTPEPTKMGSARNVNDLEAIKYWWPNRMQTLRACQEAEVLAFVYLITQEEQFGEAARRWIMHLASWDPDGPTNFRLNCEAGKPMLHRPVRAYDWAYDRLSPAEREAFHRVMIRRINDAWESGEVGRGTGHLNRPYNSHGNRTWHKIGEAAIGLYGEVPEAELWLDYALNKFFACYPVWCDDDGGWHEGLSYWAGYMSKAVWWLHVADVALGVDGFRKPFFHRVADFALYVAPPGTPNIGFGDLSHRPPSSGWGEFMEYFLRAAYAHQVPAASYWRWWADQWEMEPAEGILGFLYRAQMGDMPPPKPPTDLPPSKVFRGIGVASLHLTLLDSKEDVHFLFKSSPFGARSHGHNPQNSFQLNAYGDCLLTTCVYRDIHGSSFHYKWAHSTVAHNAVLIGGQGQVPHRSDSQGQIVDFDLTPAVDYLCGDAVKAYGGRATLALRHVVFLRTKALAESTGAGKPPATSSPMPDAVIVLCDQVAAKEPTSFQFMLHALSPFQVDESAARLTAEQPRAVVIAQYVSGVPLSFRQWDGYDPPPREKFPNQWHVEASTPDKLGRIDMITVLVPYRRGQVPSLKTSRVENDELVGVSGYVGPVPFEVVFLKDKRKPQARWRGVEIKRPFAVWWNNQPVR